MYPVVCTDTLFLFYFYTIFYFILYNTPSIPGKLNRGISVVDTVRILKGDAVTEDDIFKASILGWLIEFVSKILVFWGGGGRNFIIEKKGLICCFPLKKNSSKPSSWFRMISWMLPLPVVDNLVGTRAKVLVWLPSTMPSFSSLVSTSF
jgi:hypothetical protein